MDGDSVFSCRLCGGKIVARTWGGGECLACRSVSASLLPGERELAAYYERFNETYSGGGRSEGRNLIEYARRYMNLIGRYVRRGALIDIGSSRNPFPNVAADAGFDVTVLDFARPEGLKREVHFTQGNLNDKKILDTYALRFDVVTAWAVLEHVPDPRAAIEILSGICRPGGWVFLSTPEIGTPLTNHSVGHSGWFCPPEHLHLMSPLAVKSVFDRNGCDLVKWGRLELNALRYAVRYGIGFSELLVGSVVRGLAPRSWQRLRESQIQKFKGITYFTLRRRG